MMQLKPGQRWRRINCLDSYIIEIVTVGCINTCEKNTMNVSAKVISARWGWGSYAINKIRDFAFLPSDKVENMWWEYLEGQDAPQDSEQIKI